MNLRCAAFLSLLLIVVAAGCAPAPTASGSAAASTVTTPVAATGAPTTVVGETPVVVTPPVDQVTIDVDTPAPIPTTPAPTTEPPAGQVATPIYGYQIIHEYPHDQDAFTQGLVYQDGLFYEGTGLWSQSSLRKVAIETGEVLQIHNLAPDYFGEGISVVGDKIWQLTWQEQTAFLYDRETFDELDTVSYPTEGWGLTYDGERLIMSDGTSTLYFRDPTNFELLGQVQVTDKGLPVVRLNELEYIEGQLFANVWQTNRIAIVDPADGHVTTWLNLTGLLDPADCVQRCDVLNGIAYDAAGERLFVTGKLWPKVFEIKIIGNQALAFLPLVAKQ